MASTSADNTQANRPDDSPVVDSPAGNDEARTGMAKLQISTDHSNSDQEDSHHGAKTPSMEIPDKTPAKDNHDDANRLKPPSGHSSDRIEHDIMTSQSPQSATSAHASSSIKAKDMVKSPNSMDKTVSLPHDGGSINTPQSATGSMMSTGSGGESSLSAGSSLEAPPGSKEASTKTPAEKSDATSKSPSESVSPMGTRPGPPPTMQSSPAGVSSAKSPPLSAKSPESRPSGLPTSSRPFGGGGAGKIPVGLSNRGSTSGGRLGGAMGNNSGSKLPPSLQAKIDAMANRSKNNNQASSPGQQATSPNGNDSGSNMSLLASAASRASKPPAPPALGGLAARRAASAGGSAGSGPPKLNGAGGLNRPGAPSLAGRPGAPVLPSSGLGGGPGRRLNRPGGMTLSSMGGGGAGSSNSPFSNFSKIIDPSGKLNFDKKAILHAEGVDFSNGASFKINKEEMELQDVLGKGNYGEVRKVYHRPTKVTMAMKEIRLELDDSKLNSIIMELDILHRAIAPEIIEFYGAFLVESCVYYCMEYMDAGSLDALNFNGIPEKALARVTKSMIKGLKFLKDELQVMHRDVKPTNILANKKGEIKLVDFGVSGQLEKSLAKTNIGCQSYMAPERIKGESTGQVSTYTVSSDVWSVGLTIIELAMGCYPYPPETYSNVFAQLQAIVHGPPPKLPDHYSAEAQDFVASCLLKKPDERPTYAQLLEHPWMKADETSDVDMAAWVKDALDAKAARKSHGAPVSSSAPEVKEGHAEGPANPPVKETANAGAPVPKLPPVKEAEN